MAHITSKLADIHHSHHIHSDNKIMPDEMLSVTVRVICVDYGNENTILKIQTLKLLNA